MQWQPDNQMVERVARVLATLDSHHVEDDWTLFEDRARAAIEAMQIEHLLDQAYENAMDAVDYSAISG